MASHANTMRTPGLVKYMPTQCMPVALMLLLHSARAALRREQPVPLSRALDFLHKAYEPHVFWWELVECAKKLLLTGLLTFVFRDEVAQVAFAMLVALASVLMLHAYRPYADGADQLFALVANTDKGVEVLSLDPRFSSDFRCLRPGGVAGLTVGRCDALESGNAARETAFVRDAGRLVHSSGACVVGREQLSLSSCVAAAALEVVVVEP